jgi:hypothetical protein
VDLRFAGGALALFGLTMVAIKWIGRMLKDTVATTTATQTPMLPPMVAGPPPGEGRDQFSPPPPPGRSYMRGARLFALLILPLAACGGSTSTTTTEAPAPRGPTGAEISAPDLRNRISIFADDSMQGRRTGTPGNVKGNAYIASELRRLGLRPAGDTGSYLQRVPLMSYAADSSRATLRTGSGVLVLWKDYHPYQAQFEVPDCVR